MTKLQLTNLPALTGIPHWVPHPTPHLLSESHLLLPISQPLPGKLLHNLQSPNQIFLYFFQGTPLPHVACFSDPPPSSSWASPQEPTAAVSHAVPHLAETRFPPSQGPWSHRPSIQMCWVKDDHPHRNSSWASPNPLGTKRQRASGQIPVMNAGLGGQKLLPCASV